MSHAHTLLLLVASIGGSPRGEILDFSASWCGPCQQMSPIVSRLEREGLPIRKVDVGQEQALAKKYGITSIPAFVLIVDGEEVTRVVGMTSEAELRRMAKRIPAALPEPATPVVLASDSAQKSRAPAAVSQSREELIALEQPRVNSEPEEPGLFDRLLGRGKAQPKPVARGNNADAAQSAPAAVAATDDPMAASVRIRVLADGKVSLGSGTVIHSEPGRTLIVTCGHIFRSMQDPALAGGVKVEVDLSPSSTPQTYVGSVLGFDADKADVGLITVPTEQAVPAVEIGSIELNLAKAQPVACIGCSGGAEPTREQLTITGINKYVGPDNIECTGTPVQGRSGGGLFNVDGQLIGVCIAADREANRGLYAHAFAIHKLLDECQLTALYRAEPQAPAAEAAPTAFAANDAAPAGDEAAAWGEAPPADPAAIMNVAATAQPPAAVTADISDVSTGDAEVVVIIRKKGQPQEQNRVVIINRASSKFLAYLNGEVEPSRLSAGSLVQTSRTIETPQPPRRGEARRAKQPVQPSAETAPSLPDWAIEADATSARSLARQPSVATRR